MMRAPESLDMNAVLSRHTVFVRLERKLRAVAAYELRLVV